MEALVILWYIFGLTLAAANSCQLGDCNCPLVSLHELEYINHKHEYAVAGVPKVWMNNSWSEICTADWSIIMGEVLCHQLGFHHWLDFVKVGNNSSDTYTSTALCWGNELCFESCLGHQWTSQAEPCPESHKLICSRFSLHQTQINQDDVCQATMQGDKYKGNISTPFYPNDYILNTTCDWTISAALSGTITLYIRDFQLNDEDSLHIFDDDGQLIRLLSGQLTDTFMPKNESEIIEISNVTGIHFHFIASNSIANKGFLIEYEVEPSIVVLPYLANPRLKAAKIVASVVPLLLALILIILMIFMKMRKKTYRGEKLIQRENTGGTSIQSDETQERSGFIRTRRAEDFFTCLPGGKRDKSKENRYSNGMSSSTTSMFTLRSGDDHPSSSDYLKMEMKHSQSFPVTSRQHDEIAAKVLNRNSSTISSGSIASTKHVHFSGDEFEVHDGSPTYNVPLVSPLLPVIDEPLLSNEEDIHVLEDEPGQLQPEPMQNSLKAGQSSDNVIPPKPPRSLNFSEPVLRKPVTRPSSLLTNPRSRPRDHKQDTVKLVNLPPPLKFPQTVVGGSRVSPTQPTSKEPVQGTAIKTNPTSAKVRQCGACDVPKEEIPKLKPLHKKSLNNPKETAKKNILQPLSEERAEPSSSKITPHNVSAKEEPKIATKTKSPPRDKITHFPPPQEKKASSPPLYMTSPTSPVNRPERLVKPPPSLFSPSPLDVNALLRESVPLEFICPITRQPMRNPVLAADGHTYEKEAIGAWLKIRGPVSPKTGSFMAHSRTVPNTTMSAKMADWNGSHT